MMTAFASTDTAVEAMRLGAVDYFTKPFNMDELRLKVRQHLEAQRLKQENVLLKRALNTSHEFSQHHRPQRRRCSRVFKMIETIAKTNSTVLITGESGTGKELVARAIHYNSLRREHPFVALNCGALPETLLESELFGHMRGAFTGADTNKKGLVEVAERGTIFLDEIGEMNADDAGQAAARAAGSPVPAARRHRGGAGRHPRHRGDQPGPARSWWPRAGSARTCTTGST